MVILMTVKKMTDSKKSSWAFNIRPPCCFSYSLMRISEKLKWQQSIFKWTCPIKRAFGQINHTENVQLSARTAVEVRKFPNCITKNTPSLFNCSKVSLKRYPQTGVVRIVNDAK